VPVGQDAALLARQVAGAENGVGVTGEERFEEDGIFLRVVLEVGILNEAEIALGVADGGPDGGAFALVDFVTEEADPGFMGGEALEDVPGAIPGAVIHDDEFALHLLGEWRIEDLAEAALDDGPLVVDRDEYTEKQDTPFYIIIGYETA